MELLRIENQAGEGVYRTFYKGKSVWELISNFFVDPHLNPLPQKESRLDFDPWYDNHKIFGFISFDQLKNWFYNDYWLLKLEDYGFILSVYEVNNKNVKYDISQAVFIKKDAKLLRQVKLSDFVKNKSKYQ